jgi:hypothetical protein
MKIDDLEPFPRSANGGLHNVAVNHRTWEAGRVIRLVRGVIALTSLCSAIAGAQGLSPWNDRARFLEIAGQPDSLPPVASGARRMGADIRVFWNSALPFSLNSGTVWAGRGVSAQISDGVAVRVARRSFSLDAAIAPALVYSANSPFDILPGREPGRSTFSSPWHIGSASADLPLRFGLNDLAALTPGSSHLTLDTPIASAGVTSEETWWGPAIWNTLVLSNNAGGIPRAFVRLHPPASRAGAFTAELIAGGLTESLYFDTVSTNDLRSLSGLRLQWTPPGSKGSYVGVSRVAYRTANGTSEIAAHSLDALGRWTDIDQITSVFGRWLFPEAHLEVYGEIARTELPSFRELVTQPQTSRGYTAGLQWVSARRISGALLRVRAEATNLEQSAVGNGPAAPDFYTGRFAPQGYTERGKIIGAAIGPGSSAQFLAADLLRTVWQGGFFLGRIRWEDDAMFRQPDITYFNHDVSFLAGFRATRFFQSFSVGGEATVQERINYLFQNGIDNPNGRGTVDAHNLTIGLRIAPRA